MEKITSKQNSKVKEWAKLKTKKGRHQTGTYLLEGWHLVHEAIMNNEPIKSILVTESELDTVEISGNFQTILITEEIANHIASTVTPQGVFAIVEMDGSKTALPIKLEGAWLLLDQVQDPGNIGTMVRTADAAGFTGVIFGTGSSSRFNPKIVRSMQGSQFHIQLLEMGLADAMTSFLQAGYPVYGTELNPDAKSFKQIKPDKDFALIMGNEGNGMSKNLLTKTTANLYIPIKGKAESLNVAIAAGILMFQLLQ